MAVPHTDDLFVTTLDDADSLTINATTVQVLGQATATYANFDLLDIETNNGADSINIGNTHAGTGSLLSTVFGYLLLLISSNKR